jgi:hypothetical protein
MKFVFLNSVFIQNCTWIDISGENFWSTVGQWTMVNSTLIRSRIQLINTRDAVINETYTSNWVGYGFSFYNHSNIQINGIVAENADTSISHTCIFVQNAVLELSGSTFRDVGTLRGGAVLCQNANITVRSSSF